MEALKDSRKLICDTCGRAVDHLRRDVVDTGYNAMTKPPLWNCDGCYEEKRRKRGAADRGT